MRRLIVALTVTWLAFGLMLALTVVVRAQAPGDPDAAEEGEVIVGIVEFDDTKLYVGPDFAYDLVGELDRHDQVTVYGRRGDFYTQWTGEQWLEIDFEGETAWVYARLVRTSIPFNSIPPTGRGLPRNRDGRVPDDFVLNDDVCDSWVGEFTRTGDFMNGDLALTVTYPELQGTNVYSVIVISPFGQRTAHDSVTTTAEIPLEDITPGGGTYTWRVAPYWSATTYRSDWQQICLLQTGGTFEVPGSPLTPQPTRPYRGYFERTPVPTPTEIPFVP